MNSQQFWLQVYDGYSWCANLVDRVYKLLPLPVAYWQLMASRGGKIKLYYRNGVCMSEWHHTHACIWIKIGFDRLYKYKRRIWNFERIKGILDQNGTRHKCRDWIRSIYILYQYILSVDKLLYENKRRYQCLGHKI